MAIFNSYVSLPEGNYLYILKKRGPYSSSAQPPSAQSPQHPATRAPAPREAAPRGGTAMEEKVWKK